MRKIVKNPTFAYLKEGRKKDSGWLPKEEAFEEGKTLKVYLDSDEKIFTVKTCKCI